MRQVDFFQLQRDVQERFVAATTGVGVPSVLLASTKGRRFSRVWTLVGFAGPGVTLVVMTIGFGGLGHPLAILGAAYIGVFAIGLIVAVRSLLLWFEWKRDPSSLPYPMGVYLFPVGVVDAMTSRPRVYPFTELKALERSQPARQLVLKFSDGARFEFDAQTPERADQVVQQIQRFQSELAAAHGDPRQVAALDPLTDSGVPNPLLPTTPLVRVLPAWLRFSWLIAIVLGCILGAGLWYVRNHLSDQRMESVAVRTNTVEAFQAYLAAGGRSQAVANVWLPRAQLQLARKQGTVEAVEQFAAAHPNSKIAGEITAALREALLAKLARAKKEGKLSEILEMAKERQRYALIAAELSAAVHQAYQQALDKLLAHAAGSGPHKLFHRLMSYVQRHGPKVHVRFRSALGRSVELLDKRIRSSPYRTPELPPAQYFDSAHDKIRQLKLSKDLVARLTKEFPSELIQFEAVADAPNATAIEVPTLTVSYTTTFTGAATLRKKKKGIYVPIAIIYRTTFAIPGDPQPLEIKLTTATRPELQAIVEQGISAEELYGRMTTRCDERFVNAYLESLFKQS